MPVPDLIRDSFFGQLVYHGSRRRLFQYLEERPDFILPARYDQTGRTSVSGPESESATIADGSTGNAEKREPKGNSKSDVAVSERAETGSTTSSGDQGRSSREDTEKGGSVQVEEKTDIDPNLVDWYGPTDPERPYNVRLMSQLAMLLIDVVYIVVFLQTVAHHMQSLYPDLQHLHRCRDIRTRD